MDDREQLERAITAQEQLRGIVDDEIVDVTVASLRARARWPRTLRTSDAARRPCCSPTSRGSPPSPRRSTQRLVSDLMNDVWSRLDHIVTSFGGWIDKHIGDAVMALWGAESSNENDRSKRCAPGSNSSVPWPSSTRRRAGPLVMRVGICTGPVVLGEVATTREFTAMGDTVNVAARLEHMAPPNGVLIAHDTYRHVRGVFDVSPLDPLDVRGQDEARSRLRGAANQTADVSDADARSRGCGDPDGRPRRRTRRAP